MNPTSDEQTELLRAIWNQLVELSRSLGARVDATNTRLDDFKREVKLELAELRSELKGDLAALRTAMQSGFELLARKDSRQDRDLDEIRQRLDRVEGHVGLR